MAGPVISREVAKKAEKRPQAETWMGGFVNSILDQLKGSQMEDPTLGILMGAGQFAAKANPEALKKAIQESQKLIDRLKTMGMLDPATGRNVPVPKRLMEAIEAEAITDPTAFQHLDDIYGRKPGSRFNAAQTATPTSGNRSGISIDIGTDKPEELMRHEMTHVRDQRDLGTRHRFGPGGERGQGYYDIAEKNIPDVRMREYVDALGLAQNEGGSAGELFKKMQADWPELPMDPNKFRATLERDAATAGSTARKALDDPYRANPFEEHARLRQRSVALPPGEAPVDDPGVFERLAEQVKHLFR